MVYRTAVRSVWVLSAILGLAACGADEGTIPAPAGSGSSGGGGVPGGGGGSSTGYTQGVYKAASEYEAKCAIPRTGTDPTTGQPFADKSGTAFDEKMWLRSWTNDLYLWYKEAPDLNPGAYAVEDYFDLLKTSATTPSGAAKDRFHFTYPTDEWVALSEQGSSPGYGMTFSLNTDGPSLVAIIAYIEPNNDTFNSPALAMGLTRGLRVTEVDDTPITNTDQASLIKIYAGLFPASVGESHKFKFQNLDGTTTAAQTITSVDVKSTPVQNVKVIASGSSQVGYIQFNDHIVPAEEQLVAAINQLSSQNINELVLDVRYNGGGLLDVASELAYMIAGSGTTGKKFETLQFNDKYTTTNPVTGDPLTPVDFHTTAQGFSVARGTALPTLNLSRVFVLTGPDTCSASESIINSLRGADINVIQIGSTTCGKPYGFYPFDNCGTTYFTIQFRGINNKDFGDYTDGFSPSNAVNAGGVSVPGCSIADDFTKNLGDPAERRLAEALSYITNGSCASAPSGTSAPGLKQKAGLPRSLSAMDGVTLKPPFLRNRILRK